VILTWNIENVCLEGFWEFYCTNRYYKQYFVGKQFEWKKESVCGYIS